MVGYDDTGKSDGGNYVERVMESSISNSSQNFSLPSSSSSVVTEGAINTQYDGKDECTDDSCFRGLSSSGLRSETPQKGGRAPDMQLGRCKWIRVYDNVTYIVSGIVLRDSPTDSNGPPEILLIQESKKKCYGKWYIPAGHVEPGETIEQACKREVLEETGFECRVDQLICMETRGSGWYRMSFACTIIGGELKTKPDRESLAAGWHSVAELRKRSSVSSVRLRCRDFLQIIDEALKYRQWLRNTALPHIVQFHHENLLETDNMTLPIDVLKFAPILNKNVPQPGLFIEFVFVKKNVSTDKVECLVHGSISEEIQLLDENIDGFPTVEFGFEFFFPMVVSKCYRHIFEDGHQSIDLPEAVLTMWCLPSPVESTRHGLRLRILCRHKRSILRAPLCVPQRYHWITLENERVLSALHLLPDQYRPPLIML